MIRVKHVQGKFFFEEMYRFICGVVLLVVGSPWNVNKTNDEVYETAKKTQTRDLWVISLSSYVMPYAPAEKNIKAAQKLYRIHKLFDRTIENNFRRAR